MVSWIWSLLFPDEPDQILNLDADSSLVEIENFYDEAYDLAIIEMNELNRHLLPYLRGNLNNEIRTIILSRQPMPSAYATITWNWHLPNRRHQKRGSLLPILDLGAGDCILHQDKLVVVDEIVRQGDFVQIFEEWISKSGKLKERAHGPFELDQRFIYIGHYASLKDQIQKDHDTDTYFSILSWAGEFANPVQMLKNLDRLIEMSDQDSRGLLI